MPTTTSTAPTSTTITTIPATGCPVPQPLPTGIDDPTLTAIHRLATRLSTSANAVVVGLGTVPSFAAGWAAAEPFASLLYRMQVDLFALSGRLDEVFEAAGGAGGSGSGWTLPDGSALSPLVGPRNGMIPFEAVVIPAVLTAADRAGAEAAFTESGCGPIGALAAAVDEIAGEVAP